jgi:hypothetical protein
MSSNIDYRYDILQYDYLQVGHPAGLASKSRYKSRLMSLMCAAARQKLCIVQLYSVHCTGVVTNISHKSLLSYWSSLLLANYVYA